MIISEALRQGTRLIQSSGSDEGRVEAELLLMHALKTDRVHLYERLQDGLPVRTGDYYRRLLDRRLAHEPTPYIVGHKEFFGMEFEVTRSTLIPRPETETLVELAIDFARIFFQPDQQLVHGGPNLRDLSPPNDHLPPSPAPCDAGFADAYFDSHQISAP